MILLSWLAVPRRWIAVLAPLTALSTSPAIERPAHAMSLSSTTSIVPGFLPQQASELLTLRLTGIVIEGDAAQVRKEFNRAQADAGRRNRPIEATVELSSLGGDVREAIALGYLLRELHLPTVVRAADSCLSACAFAFLGGSAVRDGLVVPSRSIEVGGHVGFHNISLNFPVLRAASTGGKAHAANEAFELGRGAAALIIRFVADMGVEAGFVAQILGRPGSEFLVVDTVSQFMALQACPIGATPARLDPVEQALNVCVNAAGLRGQFDTSQVRPIPARELQEMLLRRSMGSSHKPSRLADHLQAVMAARNARLLADTYESLREAGVPLLDVTGSTFEVAGLPIGGRHVSCFVSLSAGQADRDDLLFSEPAVAAQRAPGNCRWLMRRPADEIVNPRRNAN
jgi:hypothetical protein